MLYLCWPRLMIIPCVLFIFSIQAENVGERRHYGLNYHTLCKNYHKTMKCIRACKSIGFDFSRTDRRCSCTCHKLGTSTVLPFFKWTTNGTTAARPKTVAIKLWDIVGTIAEPTEPQTTVATKPTDEDYDRVEPNTVSGNQDAGNDTADAGVANGTDDAGAAISTDAGAAINGTDSGATEIGTNSGAATNGPDSEAATNGTAAARIGIVLAGNQKSIVM